MNNININTNLYLQRILILDFGSQYTQLIARRVRDLGVYCEIHPYSMSDDDIQAFAPKGVILSGGPESVNECTARIPDSIFSLACPVLGICYGMQAMAAQLGGRVESGKKREFGYAQVTLREPSMLLNQITDQQGEDNQCLLDVWMSHGDHVSELPPNFVTTASTDHCAIVGMADDSRRFYGLQFHPEVSHTLQGKEILSRFVRDICACEESNWNAGNIIQEQIAEIKKQVGQDKVLLGLSGGVDSSVAALLIQQAIGDQLVCVFVDTGLLRLNEAEHIQSIFEKQFGLHLICLDASDTFLHALTGETDPEKKRKIIGQTFIQVFEQEALKHQHVKWLAQGTIYSDVIESAASSGKAHVIKSHHNVAGLPDTMTLKLLEPLRELFKDEVRAIGEQLGLPFDLVHRHPFPGPGLGVRVLGEVLPAYLQKLRLADAILIEELYKAELYHQVSQAFAVFLPIKSVGVIGDARHYDHVIAIRVVETVDFMTATWARLPYAVLERISNRIINEVPGISRVTYDISSKPPATIEWE